MGGIGFFTTNTFDWRAGTVGVNSLDVVVSLDINTAGAKFLDDDLTLDGPGAPTGVWRDAADIAFDESASLTVGSGATFDIQTRSRWLGRWAKPPTSPMRGL